MAPAAAAAWQAMKSAAHADGVALRIASAFRSIERQAEIVRAKLERGLSLELTYCFGACDMGPNVEVDGEFYDGVTPEQIDRIISGLE